MPHRPEPAGWIPEKIFEATAGNPRIPFSALPSDYCALADLYEDPRFQPRLQSVLRRIQYTIRSRWRRLFWRWLDLRAAIALWIDPYR